MTPTSLAASVLSLCSPVEERYFGAAAAHGARTLHLYPDDPRQPPQPFGYDELLVRARGAAASLDLGVGQTFLVLATSEVGAISSILGGMLSGALPVPCAPPVGLGGLEGWGERLLEIAASQEATQVVGPRSLLELLPSDRGLTTLAFEDLELSGPALADRDPVLSHIQLTSGSTASPKGVEISHANLEANLFHIGWGSEVRAEDVVVSWLPLFHDMGLVGCLLYSLYWNLDLALLPPAAFLSRPQRWLELIDRHRGTLSPAPAFAYPYLARRLRNLDLSRFDLSSWRVAYCGAEPIHAAAVRRFTQVLAPARLDPGALLPCYGLAEATLAVTFNPVGRGLKSVAASLQSLAEGRVEPPQSEEDSTELVLLGPPLPEVEVEIRGDSGATLSLGEIGRIWLRGPTVTPGYRGAPQVSACDGERFPWLDTGDLGAWVQGELVAVGRAKDVIIVHGKNHSPVEFERAAAEVSGVRAGSVVAFAIPNSVNGTEGAVLACEVNEAESDWARGAIACLVRDRVAARTGVRPELVFLLEPGAVPKTTSGKVQRSRTRELCFPSLPREGATS